MTTKPNTPTQAPAATEAPSVVRGQSEYLLGYTEGWNAARENPAEVASDAAAVRMAFLHSTNRDADGYEWGVAKVRFGADGQVDSFLWGAADSSDLDAAMPFHLRPDVLEAEAAAGGVLACGGTGPLDRQIARAQEAMKSWSPEKHASMQLQGPASAVGSSVQPVQASLSDEQIAVLSFLWGVGQLDGCGFGDRHPNERGMYWWRKWLHAAFPQINAEYLAALASTKGGASS